MQVKNLFILNETYPLPLDKYAEFKSRKDGCKGNPMCTNKLKYDAESFIADFGKKHGSKIETGEESSFVFLEDGEEPVKVIKEKIAEIKKPDSSGLILIGAILALGAYAIIKKNVMMGTLTVVLAIILLSLETPKK